MAATIHSCLERFLFYAPFLIRSSLLFSTWLLFASRISQETFRDQIPFNIAGARKDTSHIINMANEASTPVPIMHTFLKNCDYVLEKYGNYDTTSIVQGI